MPVQPDYYALLEVDPTATVEVIRAAYRAHARRDHPDHPTGSTEAMVLLNAAWAVLQVPAARAAYDHRRVARTPVLTADPIAGPAPTHPFEPGPLARRETAKEPPSAILDFGRYAGWTLGDVAARDPDYVEWLARAQVGRSFAHELDRIRHRHGWAGAERAHA